MFFTSDYQGVPVLFKSLSAATGAKAFGIFVILFATAFAFRGLSFLSTYIEQKVFASQLQASDDADNSIHIHSSSLGKLSDIESSEVSSKSERPTQTKSAVAKFFDYSAVGIYRDFIRLLLSVLTVIIGYALMLAVMSFVVLYFFAVVLGIAFGEIFFMRLSYALDMNTPDSVCLSVLH
jgi:copper transporter 1